MAADPKLREVLATAHERAAAAAAELAPIAPSLSDGGGKPPRVDRHGRPDDDGGMEARIAKLEATVEHVQSDIKELKDDVRELRAAVNGIRTTDFRLIFGALIFTALGLAGMMAHGFHWL